MEVHNALGRDMDHFIRECACLFHDRRSKGQLSLSFCIQFFRFSIALQHALTSPIERRLLWPKMFILDLLLVLDLMICMQTTLKGLWVKWLPTMRRTNFLPSLVHAGCPFVGLSLAFPFVFRVMVSTISFYWIFCFLMFWGQSGGWHVHVPRSRGGLDFLFFLVLLGWVRGFSSGFFGFQCVPNNTTL